jgi:hypothetical protein
VLGVQVGGRGCLRPCMGVLRSPQPRLPPPRPSPSAPQGVPAIALSVDNHQARRQDDYAASAALSAAIVKASGRAGGAGARGFGAPVETADRRVL